MAGNAATGHAGCYLGSAVKGPVLLGFGPARPDRLERCGRTATRDLGLPASAKRWACGDLTTGLQSCSGRSGPGLRASGPAVAGTAAARPRRFGEIWRFGGIW